MLLPLSCNFPVLDAPNVTAFGVVVFNAPAFPNCKIPALIVTPPVKVFAPESVHVPPSAFVSVPATVPSILASVPPCAPPNVRPKPEPVIVPALLMLIVPVPPTILLALPRVINPPKVAPVPELFITAPLLEIPVPFTVSASVVA